MTKFVFAFAEGKKEDKDLLGGKGANLAEMVKLGLPVPDGFTISTAACLDYLKTKMLSPDLLTQLHQHITILESKTGKLFGGTQQPLLVSVRSGAKFSMPGMMDTVLNLGLNDQTVITLAQNTKNPVFAYDCYRRLIQMFGDVVKGISKQHFESYLTDYKKTHQYQLDSELTAKDWQHICDIFKGLYQEFIQEHFPQNPFDQLTATIQAVFRSWHNPRAVTYRNLHQIPHDLGTAVNVQAMVFGNTGNNSGTGVAFTRNPSTGEQGLFGEYLLNAQGEDVVAGIRTPRPIQQLERAQPAIFQQFKTICQKLETHYGDMQDIEFTIEDGQLFILQTRNGKRTAKAAFAIALQLAKDGVISHEEALSRLTPDMMNHLLHPVFQAEAQKAATQIAKGLPASPGAATGKVYFTAEAAQQAYAAGEAVVLLRQETSPEDIEGMVVSEAIVTSRGGMTSHAAVVARSMGVCCVAGCESLEVDEFLKQAHFDGGLLKEGDLISVDGTSGILYQGTLPTEITQDFTALKTVLSWSKAIAPIEVRANAETKQDIETALKFGAKGIGLARTEHMFFGGPRILAMRRMILADNLAQRKEALAILKEYQIQDFKTLLSATEGLTCTIRLLDPPLHEFLPKPDEYEAVAQACGKSVTALQRKIAELHEINPMLGHRGCRLGVTYPEIYEMQVEAIMEAALILTKAGKKQVKPEIMIPLINDARELAYLRKILERTIEKLFAHYGQKIPYKIGAMLEIPRACLTAAEIAEYADFFSFGTNDLTQLSYGFSRDDAARFIPEYLEKGLLPKDPYQHLDIPGVGHLLQTAITEVRPKQAEISFGVCGEVGGDPDSIRFLYDIGVDYVSCSPYRVPAAWLAAAQLAVKK